MGALRYRDGYTIGDDEVYTVGCWVFLVHCNGLVLIDSGIL